MGHTVVGTVRKEDDVAAFEAFAPGKAHACLLDATDDEAVFAVIADVESTIGPLDVVIANAGVGVGGVFEETPLAAVRAQFEANVFGAAATLQAALRHMRSRRSGHLMAVTSMGGLMTVPGLSAYHGSKFALEGMLETIAKEVTAFGIHVTAIEPGSFRTDWAGRSMTRAERSISDYDELFTPIREARIKASGNQLGNPQKAAEALLHTLDVREPPSISCWAPTPCASSRRLGRHWTTTSAPGAGCRERRTRRRSPDRELTPAGAGAQHAAARRTGTNPRPGCAHECPWPTGTAARPTPGRCSDAGAGRVKGPAQCRTPRHRPRPARISFPPQQLGVDRPLRRASQHWERSRLHAPAAGPPHPAADRRGEGTHPPCQPSRPNLPPAAPGHHRRRPRQRRRPADRRRRQPRAAGQRGILRRSMRRQPGRAVLWKDSAPAAEPRWQPPGQRCPLPDRRDTHPP
ncbi:NAD(P)-dependent dehydrogenase (short-subunit alcohol dehydrogenase family) [Streptomyces tendae]